MTGPSDSREVSIVARVLGGTTWLIVSDDLAFADGVARALRSLGATVHLLDPEGRGIPRLPDADAQVTLLTAGPATPALRRALDAHAGLRGATRLQVSPARAWPDAAATPDVDALMRLRESALSADARIRDAAQRGRQQELELAELGAPRLLRAVSEVPASFVVQLSTADADAHVALDHGQWIGASYRPRERGRAPLDGMPALCRALELRWATCLVLPSARLSKPGWRQPLEVALPQALTSIHGDRQLESQRERTHGSSQRVSGTPTAQTIGPPKGRSPVRARRARHTSMVVAAAVGGFSLMALVSLLLESVQAPAARGNVTPHEPAGAIEPPPEEVFDGLRVEPLAPQPVASQRPATAHPDAQPATEPSPTPNDEAAAGAATPAPATRSDAPAASALGENSPTAEDGEEDEGEDHDDRDGAGSWLRSRRLAEQAGRSDDPARARDLYERALGNDPRNPHALVGLARLCAQEGQFEQALGLMERATAVRSKRVTYRVLHGRMLLAAGRPNEALDAFEAALRLRPDSRPAQAGAHSARGALASR